MVLAWESLKVVNLSLSLHPILSIQVVGLPIIGKAKPGGSLLFRKGFSWQIMKQGVTAVSHISAANSENRVNSAFQYKSGGTTALINVSYECTKRFGREDKQTVLTFGGYVVEVEGVLAVVGGLKSKM